MKLGFLTACMPERTLADVAAWAGRNRFAALEVACWPTSTDRDFQAAHLDVARFTNGDAERTGELMAEHGLEISALGYYENNLHHDPDIRKAVNDHVKACIDAASLLGVALFGDADTRERYGAHKRTELALLPAAARNRSVVDDDF